MTIEEFKKNIAPHMNDGWVAMDNEETGFCVEYKKELYRFNTYRKYHLIEVIGNIHENKELLK